MAGTLGNYEQDNWIDKGGARNPCTYVSSRVLAGGTHEEITIPTGAIYVLLEVTADTYVLFGASPVAAVPTDLDDGTACERIGSSEGKWFICGNVAKISVVSAGAAIVTASFYKN